MLTCLSGYFQLYGWNRLNLGNGERVKGDSENPVNCSGITLLSVVGNNRLVPCLDKEGAMHEGKAGF